MPMPIYAVMGRMAQPKRIISYRFTFATQRNEYVGRGGRGGVIAVFSFRCLHMGDIVNKVFYILKEWVYTGVLQIALYVMYIYLHWKKSPWYTVYCK